MDRHQNLTVESFGMVLTAAFLVVVGVFLVEPMSKRLASIASQSIVSDSTCGGASSSNAALACALYRVFAPHR